MRPARWQGMGSLRARLALYASLCTAVSIAPINGAEQEDVLRGRTM